MRSNKTTQVSGLDRAAAFSESEAWRDVGAGWQPLYGSFRGVGYSFEWHDFQAKREFDWCPEFSSRVRRAVFES
ncbi:MAG: hypothetical protein QM813_22155 [Verrucomicrobiota bacterium]